MVSFCNQAGLIMLNSAIRTKFHSVDPFGANNFMMRGRRNKDPSMILLESQKFSSHGLLPMIMFDNLLNGGGFK